VGSDIEHILFQIHTYSYVPGSGKIIRYYVKKLMHRDTQDREYYHSEAGMKKDVPERKVPGYIDSDEKSNSKKDDAG
jgi:hypothetical protein